MSPEGYVGSLDQGTTSTRFIIFDHSGSIVAQEQKEHRQILPAPGWVEHDASEIWEATQEVIRGALVKAGIQGSDLRAIGITNQRETTIAWDTASGKPLHNAIVWQDTRTQSILDAIPPFEQQLIRHTSGLTIAPYFSGSKMRWLLQESSDVQAAAAKGTLALGTIDSWLVWNLTGGVDGGVHITDVTNASRTLLMDLKSLQWDPRVLQIFQIPQTALPTIKSSSEVYGVTREDGAVGAAVPIAAILGDQQAAMVGQVCFERGESKTTYGTGNFALLNTGEVIVHSNHGLLTTVCYKFGDSPAKYALEGSVAVTGSAVQWLRDQLGIINSASEIEALAASVSDNGGVYFVPAFSGLFAPHWRSDARGAVVGLTRAATKAHLARATLEAICYQTRDVIDAMAQETGVTLREMRVDGGITANSLCMQMQASILGATVTRPVVAETTALGAAYAAGLATGFWSSTEELKTQWKISQQWQPVAGDQLASTGYENWKKALTRTLDWV